MYWQQHSWLLVGLFLIVACTSGPQPIDYGNELCHFCKMTISDQRFGSELITDKEKAYKYDAIECLVQDEPNHADADYELYVTDFFNPGTLIPTEESIFLISEGVPSPMGAYLSAYHSEKKAREQQEKHGGNLFDWPALKTQLK